MNALSLLFRVELAIAGQRFESRRPTVPRHAAEKERSIRRRQPPSISVKRDAAACLSFVLSSGKGRLQK